MWLGLIHAVFPSARILHTMRLQSIPAFPSTEHTYANDLSDLAHFYREYHRLMAHWRSVLPPV